MRQFAAITNRFQASWVLFISLLVNSSPCWSEQNIPPFEYATEGNLFTLQGSNTIGAHLAPQWVKAYLEAKGLQGVFIEPMTAPNEYRIKGRNGTRFVSVEVHAHGSSTGFAGLSTKTAQIAMASRSIKDIEAKSLTALGDLYSPKSEHVVAIDGLAIIVNPKNALNEITVSQAAEIFAGKITNWQTLGGPDRIISVYARDDNSGTFDTFKSLVLQNKYALTARAQRFESNDELSDEVSNDIGGIGFVGLASVRNAKALAVADKNTTALKPDILLVATEDYPLSRRLFMYTAEEPADPVNREFVDFSQSLAGQNIVEEVGFVSQNPKGIQAEFSQGPQSYLSLTKVARRLSVNFRFVAGSADLDNKALQDVERLARFITQENASGIQQKFIQLVGFSNVESTEKRAQVLSRLRATAVKTSLYRYGVTTESVIGFGDNMPVANIEGSAAVKNERVEVWVFSAEQLSEVDQIKDSILSMLVSGNKELSLLPL